MFLSNGPDDNYELGSHVPLDALKFRSISRLIELRVWDFRQACVSIVSYNKLRKAIVASDSTKQIRTYFVPGDILY